MTITQRDSNNVRISQFFGRTAENLYMQLLGSNIKHINTKDQSKKVIQVLQDYKYVIDNEFTLCFNENNYFVISN